MFSGFHNLFSSGNDVGFIKPPKIDPVSQEKDSVEKLSKRTWDAQKTTLELELEAKPLRDDDVRRLARSAMANHQPEAYVAIAKSHPNVITPKFTDDTMHEMKPANQFVSPLKASGYPATIFDKRDTTRIKEYRQYCSPSSHYVVNSGEMHDFSDFETCNGPSIFNCK